MSRRHQPEYRTSSSGGGLIAIALVLIAVLALTDKPVPPVPETPDINIAIDIPTTPTTVPTPTSTVGLQGAQASGHRHDTPTGVNGTADLQQRATEWAQDFVRGCITGQLTGRGLCIPWPNNTP